MITTEVTLMKNCVRAAPNLSCLVDVRDIHIDSSLPQEERIRSFVRQVRDPYHFRVGDVAVSVSYANCSCSLNDRFSELLSLMG